MLNKYALVVGGTGMLEKVNHWLIEQEYDVYVIGRSRAKLDRLKQETGHPAKFHGISVDYEDSDQFASELKRLFKKNGIPKIVVSWIHSSAPQALPLVNEFIKNQDINSTWYLFHIQGSARFLEKENTPVPENCLYRRVYLGFILEKNRSRWLSHDEISNGIIQAIKNDQQETVVGTLEPWDKRP